MRFEYRLGAGFVCVASGGTTRRGRGWRRPDAAIPATAALATLGASLFVDLFICYFCLVILFVWPWEPAPFRP